MLSAAVLLLVLPFAFGLSDVETSLDVPGIIRYYGFPLEEHMVTTEDSYLLKVFRIPSRKKDAPVVYLQHGLLCSSADWILSMRNGSLAFILADAGFDVWLGNSRGNTYALGHSIYSYLGQKFWDFSWDELSMYDLPATLSYVKNVTGKRTLGYVGHSQGTLTMFSLLSRKPEWANSVNIMIALAPVAKVTHVKGTVDFLRQFSAEAFYIMFGRRSFLPNSAFMKTMSKLLCTDPLTSGVCGNLLFSIAGYDREQMNHSRVAVYTKHTPAGTSVKNMIHFLQMSQTDSLQLYDYGKRANLRRYNSDTPPKLNLTQIRAPVALFTAGEDYLSSNEDVAWLVPRLRNIVFRKHLPSWNHLNFLWALNAPSAIYKNVVRLLRKHHKAALKLN